MNDDQAGSVTGGIVDRNVPAFGRDAFRHALSLARGEKVPTVLEIPLPFRTWAGQTPPELRVTPATEKGQRGGAAPK